MSIKDHDLGWIADPLPEKQQRFLVTVRRDKQFFRNDWDQAVRQTGVTVIKDEPVQVVGDRAIFLIAGARDVVKSLFAYPCVVQLQETKPGRIMRAQGSTPKKKRKREYIPEKDSGGKINHFAGFPKRPKWHGKKSGDTIPLDAPACPKTRFRMKQTNEDAAVSAAAS
jgi:hypothetical protein